MRRMERDHAVMLCTRERDVKGKREMDALFGGTDARRGMCMGAWSRFEGGRLTPVTLSAITPNPILPIAEDTLNSVLYSAP